MYLTYLQRATRNRMKCWTITFEATLSSSFDQSAYRLTESHIPLLISQTVVTNLSYFVQIRYELYFKTEFQIMFTLPNN